MTDPTDLVEYLRRNAVFNYKDTYLKAADEIERLREELEDAKIQLANMEEDYFRVRDHNER